MMPCKAVIIGSGIGGLSIGIILQKLGFAVTIVEKNPHPGGLMRSFTRAGIDCPVGIHYIGSMAENQPLKRMLDNMGISLPVERMGIDNPIDTYIFDDFRFELPEGLAAFEAKLKETLPQEADNIDTLMSYLYHCAERMYSLDFLFSNEHTDLIFDLFLPMGELLKKYAFSKKLRSILEVASGWIGVPLEECPIFFYGMTLGSYLLSAWRLRCTGIEAAEIFAHRFKDLGGSIILNSEVTNILVESREVKGITLQSGESINAPIVIACIHPQNLLKMLPDGATKPAYMKRIQTLENTSSIFSVHLALAPDNFPTQAHNTIRIYTDSEGKIKNAYFFQLRENPLQGKQDKNILTIITMESYEEWKQWQDTVSQKRGAEYKAKKQQKAAEILVIAAEIFGKLDMEDVIDIYTPLTIRDWVNSPHGSAYGVTRSATQLIKASALNRTSIQGLYLGGQSTLAPGVLGTIAGSYATVKHIIGAEAFNSHFEEIHA